MLKITKLLELLIATQKEINKSIKELKEDIKPKWTTISTNTDFIIFSDDGTSEKIPVVEYYIERIQKQIDKHYIGYELLEQILKEIKEYCKIKE